jgi:hypothetical protein
MLHLVRLGMGLAVVNACCRIHTALTTRPIPELPSIQYHLIYRREGLTGAAAGLCEHLRAHAEGCGGWGGGKREPPA